MGKDQIIWDGDCGFCQATVTWLMSKDRNNQFEEHTAQSLPLTPQETERSQREVLLKTQDGRTLGGADAVLYALRRTKFGFLAWFFSVPPFIIISRLAYRFVARNRSWISKRFLKGQSCRIPPKR